MPSNLVSNPGFETGSFTNWTVTDTGSGDIGVDNYSGDVHSGNYGVYAGNAATTTLSQNISTVVGATYTVSFSLNVYQADATNGFMKASFGGIQFETLNEPTETDQFTTYSASIVATSTHSLLQFSFNDPAGFFGFDDASVVQTAVCYVSGTRIRTTRGEVAVEALRVGDLAVTSSGACRPIRWIGHRTTRCRHHREPEGVWPVRIAAHAIGEGRPARDLWVSPGHALCLDVMGEVLVPASALLNGTTVAQVAVDTVTYWHVELDSHDILMAEGLPAESYLATGNRHFFVESGALTLHAAPDPEGAALTHADFCRPFHMTGALVDAVRDRIDARAARMGWRFGPESLGQSAAA